MAIVPFGEWLPDQPTLENAGALVARNVVPSEQGYRGFPSLTPFSTSLSAKCVGAIAVRDNAGTAFNYAGEGVALRQLVGTSWSAVTRLSGGAYTTGADDFWEFVQWNQTVFGVNGLTDLPQRISLGAANFANMSGVGMPKARHIAVLREFVVLGNISDSALGVTRVRWSTFNNPNLTWAPDPATLADYQDLPTEAGWVQKVVGGDEYGLVFQERAITRMTFAGSPLVFRFDPIARGIGAYAPQSVVGYQNLVFFLAEDGFYGFDGSTITPIGRGKIDRTFFRLLLPGTQAQIIGAVDAFNKIVVWAYTSTDGMTGICDRLIIYNWAVGRWSEAVGLSVEYIWKSITGGYTLDGLDAITTNLDSLTPNLDSRFWVGNTVLLTATTNDHRLNLFNGSHMPATVGTGEWQAFRELDQLAYITQIRPIVEGGSAQFGVALLGRNSLVGSASAINAVASVSTGLALVRATARYHRANVTTSHDFAFAIGIDVQATPAGRRGGLG